MAFGNSPYGGNQAQSQRQLRQGHFVLSAEDAKRVISAEVIVYEDGRAWVKPRVTGIAGTAASDNSGNGVRYPFSEVEEAFLSAGFDESVAEPVRESGKTGLVYKVLTFYRCAKRAA